VREPYLGSPLPEGRGWGWGNTVGEPQNIFCFNNYPLTD
jgi:hypothetical protein